jgi:G6PDH family F420-dependent oxidoreductase
MLEEAIDIIRLLWQGGTQSYDGQYLKLENARVYDLPKHPPPVVVGISGPSSAQLAAKKGDGIISTEPDAQLIESWKSYGGGAGPRYFEATICWGQTEDEALRLAHERFRFGQLGWKVMAELPNVGNFEAASRFVRPEDVREKIPCGPDVQQHVAAIQRAQDAGFDHIVILQAGPDQKGFFRFWEEKLRPALEVYAGNAAR